MPDAVVVDTDVLIDAGRGVKEAVTCLEQIEKQATLSISVVTQMELIVGCRNKTDLRALERFLARFQILKLNEAISDATVQLLNRYRLSHGLLIADALIAATVLTQNFSFATKNERDYRFIGGLKMLSYPLPFA
ncbi:MAG: type II toxin-antitoxin system VapC family toxin [Chloroflexi bacterium]|nr:type II toxin-antitoxin system VapC family toxin [Chloroflexota bacterium]MBI3742419.1 type II toxin-antitoxin system VapC family toxin [Chloroflexota bacterium]